MCLFIVTVVFNNECPLHVTCAGNNCRFSFRNRSGKKVYLLDEDIGFVAVAGGSSFRMPVYIFYIVCLSIIYQPSSLSIYVSLPTYTYLSTYLSIHLSISLFISLNGIIFYCCKFFSRYLLPCFVFDGFPGSTRTGRLISRSN